MKRTQTFVCAAILMLSAPLHASAQSSAQLKSENADLRAQLQALQQRCGPQPVTPPTSQAGHLDARIASIRVGPATGYAKGHIAVTVAMTLTNTSSAPMALNYEKSSYAVTDNNGYQYNLSNEHLSEAAKQDVKGIPIATPSRASATQMLPPGGSSTVTFIARRNMRDGQTAGTVFDVQATFGQYRDEGQGRIRKINSYPIAFTGVGAGATGNTGAAPNAATGAGSRELEDAASRLLDRLIK